MPESPGRRRRVRTGCLTCRSRKVKCDEARPSCFNCTRLNRACLYPSPLLSVYCVSQATEVVNETSTPAEPSVIHGLGGAMDTSGNNPTHQTADEQITMPSWDSTSSAENESMDFNFITGEWGDIFPGIEEDLCRSGLSPDPAGGLTPTIFEGLFPDAGSPFEYFLCHVEPPFITPWDSSNWALAKPSICQLATSHAAISTSIWALEDLYESLLAEGDTSGALAKYFGARHTYLLLLKDDDSDIDVVLVATFLLCCFEIVAQHETVSNTLKQRDILITRLERRPRSQPWSPISGRIVSWLHLFHTKALHLGGRGMLSPKALELLHEPRVLLPLTHLRLSQPTASDVALQAAQQSLYAFYFELQRISAEVSGLNRHHRPRGSLEDELKVDQLSQDIQQRLAFLWQGRPWLLDLPPEEVCQFVSCPEASLDDLILLMRLCRVSYFAEIIYHARGHGKLPFGAAYIANARREVWNTIRSATEECHARHKLHPAFLWPLFVYSVESTESEDVERALRALEPVSNCLWSSTGIVELIHDLTKEQLRRGARVDSRYFCIEKFGTVPPFM